MKNIGGQAVIEGVMMKSPLGWSVAVRGLTNEISLKTVKTKKQSGILKLPVIRGVAALFHALYIGIKAIEFSANMAYQKDAAYQEEEKSTNFLGVGLSIAVAAVLAIGLFKFLPLYFTTLIGGRSEGIAESSLLFNFVDGLFRVGIFLFYVFIIGLWKEMKRVYQYHGAEHKVIYAYEAGSELTVENAKKYKPYHPRCGTSFLLIVMVISIMVFMTIPQHWSFIEKLISRIVLIPFVAGVSYEALRFSAKTKDNPLIKLIILPGLVLQRLTVREPDDSQIEVALTALKEVLKLEGEKTEVL
jgi:uncharacterized protein YqhQ